MTTLDPLTGERAEIDTRPSAKVIVLSEARIYREAERKARADINRLIDEMHATVRKHYPQSDSGDEVSYEGC